MTLTHVPTRIRDMPSTVDTIGTTEPWLLATFEFLMIGQATLAAEAAAAVGAMKFLIQHLGARIRLNHRRHHRHRCRGRHFRCRKRWRIRRGEYVAVCDWHRSKHAVIHAWNTKKTRRSRQSSSSYSV